MDLNMALKNIEAALSASVGDLKMHMALQASLKAVSDFIVNHQAADAAEDERAKKASNTPTAAPSQAAPSDAAPASSSTQEASAATH
jgi:hypothetical protein